MRLPSRVRRLLCCGFLLSAVPFATAAASESVEPTAEEFGDARELTAWIDGYLSSFWERQQITPADPASDAAWLRRASLDLSGVIPHVWEVREFLADEGADRHERVVERLLYSPAYATHIANVWSTAMMPEGDTNPNLQYARGGTEVWLRNRFAKGWPYDETVRELLTYPIPRDAAQVARRYNETGNPVGFFVAKETQPEKLAATTARFFLGVRIECAQCHDHPFADWKQEDFWQLAAFYAGLRRENPDNEYSNVAEDESVRKIAIGETDQMVNAAFLDGSQPEWADDTVPRAVLADWLTSEANSYFARATVNRLWAMLFGDRLVQPVDDFDRLNPPRHLELLDHLADEFIAHDYDFRHILRAVVMTRAYRLSSEVTHPSQKDRRALAVMPVRGLTPEQFMTSLVRAMGGSSGFTRPGNQELLEAVKSAAESSVDYESSIIQALHLMNGWGNAAASADKDKSGTVAALVAYPGMTPPRGSRRYSWPRCPACQPKPKPSGLSHTSTAAARPTTRLRHWAT